MDIIKKYLWPNDMETNIEDNKEIQLNYFSRLPDELMMKIFRFLLDSSSYHCLGHVVPLVCKRWYAIAKDPHLWTRISLDNKMMSVNQISSLIRSMPLLKSVKLEDISKDEIYQSVLTTCQHLKCLKLVNHMYHEYDMSSNLFSNISSKSIQHISFIWLKIKNDDILNICQRLPNLTSIEIKQCEHISNLALDYIAVFVQGLKVLIVDIDDDDGNLVQSVRKVLQKHQNYLMQLELCCSNLPENGLFGIEHCKNLVKLSVIGCALTNRFLKLISDLHHLSFLKLRNGNFSESIWCHFLHHRVCSLKALHLIDCAGLSDTILEKLALKSPRLYFLRLCYVCDPISDRGLTAIINNCAEMTILGLLILPHITCHPLLQIPQTMPQLKVLRVSGCGTIKDDDLEHLSRMGVPVLDCSFTVEDPFGNVLCDHFAQINTYGS